MRHKNKDERVAGSAWLATQMNVCTHKPPSAQGKDPEEKGFCSPRPLPAESTACTEWTSATYLEPLYDFTRCAKMVQKGLKLLKSKWCRGCTVTVWCAANFSCSNYILVPALPLSLPEKGRQLKSEFIRLYCLVISPPLLSSCPSSTQGRFNLAQVNVK